MAEAIAAIGLGASIIQFVSLADQLIRRVKEFSSSADQVPKALRSITVQLPFLVETCRNLDVDNVSSSVAEIIRGCQQEVMYLYSLVDEVLPVAGDPKFRRAIKALQSVRYQEKFEFSSRKLESLKTGLILHCCQTTNNPKDDPSEPSLPHNLPPPPTSLSVARDDVMHEISQGFEEYDGHYSGHKIVVLLGMGGQGKSRLAHDYGRRSLNDDDSRLVLWIDATSVETLVRCFEDVADRWNDRKRRFVDSDSRIAFVKTKLTECPSLLILDNYDYPDRFPHICNYIPAGCDSILITSRHAKAGNLGKVVRIEGIDEQNGLRLLLHRSQLDINDHEIRTEATKILDILGYLPLAIDQAGAYIRDRGLPLRDFVENYKSRKEEVLSQRHVYWDYKKRLQEEEKDETPLGVLTTWELSIREIGKAKIPQSAIERLMTVTAFLGHLDVSESLFKEYAARVCPVPQWLMWFMVDGQWSHDAFREVVAELSKLSLTQSRDSDAAGCSLSLHPMIKDWLQLRLSDVDRCDHLSEAIKILANYIKVRSPQTLLQEARSLLNHLSTCIDSYKRQRKRFHWPDFRHLREHKMTIFSFFMIHGRYQEAEEGFGIVLEHDVQEFGESHAHTLQSTRNLADAHIHCGKYIQAQKLLMTTLKEKTTPLKGNLETFHILCALANVHAKIDRPEDAEKYYETALDTYGVQGSPSQKQEFLPIYDRLAEVKRYLGKQAEAETLYNRAYHGYEEECAYDEDATLDMLRTAGGLADLLRTQARYQEAEISYREAWQGYKKQLGPDHPKTIAMLTSLAISCRNQENYQDAESYLEESVKLFQSSLGSDHPDTLRALMNLSICIDRQGHYEAAEARYWEVLKGREAKLGLDHPYTLRTIERLAHMLWMQGQHAKAESVVARILIKTGKLSRSLASDREDRRNYKALEMLYTEALERMKQKLSNDHVDVLETYECLRLVYIGQGELQKAQNIVDEMNDAKNPKTTAQQRDYSQIGPWSSLIRKNLKRYRHAYRPQQSFLYFSIGLVVLLVWYHWMIGKEK